MVIKKEAMLYARDEAGKLIPQEVALLVDEKNEEQLTFKGQTVKIIPLTRGEVKKMFATVTEENEKDVDGELIVKHCKDPQFTIEEVAHMRPIFATLLVNTILYESGLDIAGKSKKKAVQDKEDDFAKN